MTNSSRTKEVKTSFMLFENISVILKLVCTISVIVLTDEYHSPFFFSSRTGKTKAIKNCDLGLAGNIKNWDLSIKTHFVRPKLKL